MEEETRRYHIQTRERIQVEMEKTERRLDENIIRKHPIYKAGDFVKKFNNTKQNKLEPAWKGPFEVIVTWSQALRIRKRTMFFVRAVAKHAEQVSMKKIV